MLHTCAPHTVIDTPYCTRVRHDGRSSLKSKKKRFFFSKYDRLPKFRRKNAFRDNVITTMDRRREISILLGFWYVAACASGQATEFDVAPIYLYPLWPVRLIDITRGLSQYFIREREKNVFFFRRFGLNDITIDNAIIFRTERKTRTTDSLRPLLSR